MSTVWVRVRHSEHGGESVVPKKALPGYRRRGWQPLTPIADGLVTSALHPEIATDAAPADNPGEIREPETRAPAGRANRRGRRAAGD